MREMTVSSMAEILGTTRRTLNNRVAHLSPERCEGKAKYYNSEKAIRCFFKVELRKEFENEFKESLKVTSSLPAADSDFDKQRLGKAKADMEELKLQEKRGELVEITEVQQAVEKEYNLVRTTLLAIPTKKAKALSVIDSPANIQTELEEVINEALAHLEKDKNE